MTDAELLRVLKTDLELVYDSRSELGIGLDNLLHSVIASAITELRFKGINIDLGNIDDFDLVRMFAAYKWKCRKENIPMPDYLRRRILERLLHEKVNV